MAESTDELGIDRYYRSFSAGTTLYYAGAPATELYLIRTGRVQLVKRARGIERSIGLYGASEIVGEEALLPGAHRSASAQAIEPVSALVIESDTFRALVRRRPDLGEGVMQQLARRLQRAGEQIENFLAGAAVKIPGRFVGQQDRRPLHERSGDSHSLTLTTRHLIGTVLHTVLQADPLQRFHRPGAATARPRVNQR